MDKELTIITEPEELIAWADTFDILLNPSIEWIVNTFSDKFF